MMQHESTRCLRGLAASNENNGLLESRVSALISALLKRLVLHLTPWARRLAAYTGRCKKNVPKNNALIKLTSSKNAIRAPLTHLFFSFF